MEIDALIKYSDLIETFVVIVSVIYLATQLKQNTKMIQAQAAQAQVTSYSSTSGLVSQNPKVWRDGLQDFESLSPDNKVIFIAILNQITRNIEGGRIQYLNGTLNEQLWQGLEFSVQVITSSNGFRAYWKARKNWHGSEFKKWMETEVLKEEESDKIIKSFGLT